MKNATGIAAMICALCFACGDSGDDATGGASSVGGSGGSGAGASGGGGGGLECSQIDCDASSFCYDGACHPCAAPTGTLHDQTLPLGDDLDDRYYFLHVPASYACDAPASLLVDFHGTAGGDAPEEAYQLDALVQLSESEGVIVVRPRSRSSSEGGVDIYRWDQNPGDLDRNVTFTQNLVESLKSTYRIDDARVYASGFSSGSNMASQFLDASRVGLFHGLAPIAGGIWTPLSLEPFATGSAPRIYEATGYRDYLHPTRRDLESELRSIDFPEDKVFFRETDTGHDLYAWHFPELYAWLDRGERPTDSPLEAGFTEEVVPTPSSLVAVVAKPDGTLVATTAEGEILDRAADGTWSLAAVSAMDTVLTGACANDNGDVFATGEGSFLRAPSGGAWSTPKQLPELGLQMFGFTFGNGVACSNSDLVIAGYWSGISSVNAGDTFADVVLDNGGYEAQASAAVMGPSGTTIAVGYYDYVGRRASGDADASSMAHPSSAEWWNDVATIPGGGFAVVGDSGAILISADDGMTWQVANAGTSEPLYAVAFGSATNGVAVGKAGTVLFTKDGGVTWTLGSTGRDGFLGGVVFLDSTTALVVGEHGTALRFVLP